MIYSNGLAAANPFLLRAERILVYNIISFLLLTDFWYFVEAEYLWFNQP